MPAVPIAEISPLRLSSPRIGTLPWDQIYLEPALDRIAAERRHRMSAHAGRTATQTEPSPSTVRADGAPSSASDSATARVSGSIRSIVRDAEHATQTASAPTATPSGWLQPLAARSIEVTHGPRLGVEQRDPVGGSSGDPHAVLAHRESGDRRA